jgi:phenol 2-monooxygenase
MQYHLNGFDGCDDPLKYQFKGAQEPDFQTSLPSEVDILIVGAGPAGQLLGAQLAQFPDITTRIIEPKPGPLQQGNADGLQCRTIEICEAFGFSERVLKEAYWVMETTFWGPNEDGKGLRRTGKIRDTEEGLSEFPHVILNQARLQGMWLDAMKWSPTRLEPSYSRMMAGLTIPDEGPVEVVVERSDGDRKGEKEHVRAKYVVGCDGARSAVRQSMGLQMVGDFANQAWGVMDALVVTDFPDLRLKSTIHSASDGSIIIIPREGGYLTRFYIGLDKLKPDERVADKNITPDVLVDRAQRIFKPYNFDVKHIGHWSVYEVGQRLTDHFDDVLKSERDSISPRVFIAGDACHTHSAKAGQGMNVSMNDTYNLGWKLASVFRGQAHPKLLHTYSAERQPLAQTLIDFDREISRLSAAKPKTTKSDSTNGDTSTNGDSKEPDAIDPAVFQTYFQRQGRFMAGLETRYQPSLITSANTSHQHLATGFQIGTRFHSAQVLRLADAKPVQLGHVMKADGRWRIILFGPSNEGNQAKTPLDSTSRLMQTCEWLEETLIPRFTPKDADVDSVFDVRAVFPQVRSSIDVPSLPEVLLPHKGKFKIQDYEKVFTDEESYGWGFGEVYKNRGVSPEGCVVVVRPDQYISAVLPLGEEAFGPLGDFFGGLLRKVGGVNGHT